MGFGKFLKDKIESRNQAKIVKEKIKLQIQDDVRNRRFCDYCHRTGEFDNKCDICKDDSLCDNCVGIADKGRKTICRKHWDDWSCNAGDCPNLKDDSCVSCGNTCCNDHFLRLFNTKDGVVWNCPVQHGFVCFRCVDAGKEGTFRKKYLCPRCSDSRNKIELMPDLNLSSKYRT